MSWGVATQNGVSVSLASVVSISAGLSEFGPADLFVGGVQGAWYDPSDYSTLFQDTLGSTPVTAVEQPVALILDKSQLFNENYPAQFFSTIPIAYNSGKTAITAGLEVNAAIANAGVYYVKPSTGSNANPGTLASPFATVDYAMRTATGAASRVVMLEDCVIAPFDLRNTDASQTTQQFKWLDANGFNVIIRVTGPALSSQTWVQDGTYTNCWTSTLSVGASQFVTRVLNSAVLDDYGYDTPLRQYSSSSALNSATDAGYYWDNVGKVLWLNIGGNVETQKANYRALYSTTAGTARIYVQGSALGISGVRMEGIQFLLLDGGSRRPEIWINNTTQLWSYDKGADVRGWYVSTNSLCYASQGDGANGYDVWAGGKSLVQTVNCRFIRSGDVRTFAVDNTLQGVSAHGGCSHISYGSQFIQSNGQGVGDTCVNSSTDYSWLQDCTVVGGAAGVTAANVEFGSAATSAFRYAFLDNVSSTSAPANGAFRISTNGVAQQYRTLSGTVVNGPILPYGNHATQATAASQPVLRARYNLLTYSEQIDNAAWTKTFGGTGVTPAVTPNVATAPDGTVTADLVVFDRGAGTTTSDVSYISQSITAFTANATSSVWLKTSDGSTKQVNLRCGSVTITPITVTGTWQRFSTSASGSSVDRFSILLYGNDGNQVASLYVWGAQLSYGSSAGNYQKIAASTVYDSSGFLPYLSFDGSNDSLSTLSINFSASDKVSVFAGLTKLSDATLGMVAELSVNSGGNNGAFGLRAPYNALTADYGILSNGTAAAGATATTYAAPITNVVTGLGNISGPAVTLRVNATQVANVTTSQGTGNYGNYPLYIGRRGNVSFPFNGRVYSLIIAGKMASASEISSTEAWVNGKTGAY